MRIEVTKGHLTQTEKKHIKLLFSHKMTEGKVNRKNYYIEKIDDNNSYKVLIIENTWSDYEGKLTPSKNTSFFNLI